MAWSYDHELLHVPLNAVRLRIGDTTESRPLFTDEELQSFIDATGSTHGAALAAARVLRARAAREVDKWVGDLKILASQRYRAYTDLVEELEPMAGSTYGVPSAGGIRVSDKEEIEENDDLVAPSFRRGLHDYTEEP